MHCLNLDYSIKGFLGFLSCKTKLGSFKQMPTVTGRCLSLIEKCKNLKQLKQAHSQSITCGLKDNSFALSRLLAFCSSNPLQQTLSYGIKIFKHIQNPTNCICNTVIKACFINGDLNKTIHIYMRMLANGIVPDNYTLPYVLKACMILGNDCLGELIHGHGLKLGLVFDDFVGNSLIAVYIAFDKMDYARYVFDEMPDRSVVSWTVLISGYANTGDVDTARLMFDEAPVKDRALWGCMISGYVQNNCFKEGLELFQIMQTKSVVPDEAIFVTLLSASANLGALDIGTWINRYLGNLKLRPSARLGTAMIDMYAKCGKLDLAEKVFDEMPERDTIAWNAMISGLAMHGHGERALVLFSRMEKEGILPDDITFIALFTACSYSGLAREGLRILSSMLNVYKLEPKAEHLGCITDFLSRYGLFEEAKMMIERISNSSCPAEEAIAWRALLSSCNVHGKLKLGEIAAERLVQLERHSGAYVLLSNLYSTVGKHDNARRIRKTMRKRGIEKIPGCSTVEINGVVHEFTAGEKTHPHMEPIHAILEIMKKHSD